MLKRQEVDEIAAKRFRLDCPRMRLIGHNAEERFAGAGEISFGEDQQLQLVLYSPEYEIGVDDIHLGVAAGEFLPETDFYRLEATDLGGRSWEASDVRPEVSGVVGGGGAVVRSKLFELTHRTDPERGPGSGLWLYFSGISKIPLNFRTATTVRRAKGTSQGFKLDQWIVENDELELQFSTREGGFELDVSAPADRIRTGLDTRIEESFWFALGCVLQWDILIESTDAGYRAAIRNHSAGAVRGLFRPPVEWTSRTNEDAVAEVILKYLEFLREYHEPRYHPLSTIIRRVIYSSAGTIEDYALGLAVGVEAVVGQHFSDWGQETDDVKAAVDLALHHMQTGRGYEAILPRVRGCLQSIRGSSARTALRQLARAGLISENGRAAWERVRHPAAHGDEYDFDHRQLVRFNDQVQQVILQLVLRVIGYTGIYSDHTRPGWPDVELEPSGIIGVKSPCGR